MRKEQRIKKNKEFQHVFQKGKSMANRQFVIYAVQKADQPVFRIGLSVSKKIGNAVTRNRIKRLVRQAVHEIKEQLPGGVDIVIIARKPAADMSLEEVKKSLQHVIRKLPTLSAKNKL
ncbi:ribonuclease P protein component [Sutcliffiella horikoshii]|uniref:ribonuclease P protein component n=1 Tax=Sutcliffiella horikoshii TaxID=79883 RepID=UPI001CFC98A1|nr:ribonuclease P protein component [Sutcliffiella horikoshii]